MPFGVPSGEIILPSSTSQTAGPTKMYLSPFSGNNHGDASAASTSRVSAMRRIDKPKRQWDNQDMSAVSCVRVEWRYESERKSVLDDCLARDKRPKPACYSTEPSIRLQENPFAASGDARCGYPRHKRRCLT